MLAGIFEEVLGIAGVGAEESFFELGGHSLLATQVASRVREGLEEEVGLRQLFEEPTVRGLAAVIIGGAGEGERVERRAEILLRLSLLSDDQVDQLLDESPRHLKQEQSK